MRIEHVMISSSLVLSLGMSPAICLCCALAASIATMPSTGLCSHVLVIASAACLLRAGVVASTLLHEAAHLLFCVVGHKHSLCASLTKANLMGHTDWRVWLGCLNPMSRLPPSFQPHIELPIAHSTPSKQRPAEQCPVQCQIHSAAGTKLQCQSSPSDYVISETNRRDNDWSIRVAGWLSSLVLAGLLQMLHHYTAHSAWPMTQHLADSRRSAEKYELCSLLQTQLGMGFWVTAAASLGSDILCSSPVETDKQQQQQRTRRFHCGNFGIMVANAATQAMDMVKVLQEMCSVCMVRGAQSAGVVALSGGPQDPNQAPKSSKSGSIRVRVKSSRRGDVASDLTSALRQKLRWSMARPLRCSAGSAPRILLGHCRFATSSVPTAAETHPHQWTPTHPISHWQAYSGNPHDKLASVSKSRTNGRHHTGSNLNGLNDDSARAIHGRASPQLQHDHEQLEGNQLCPDQADQSSSLQPQPDQAWRLGRSQRPHGLFVTHNGDFECFELFGWKKTCAEVMPWLAAVLDAACPASCDSVAIAGLMELFRTQGLWLESLRLAYQQCAAEALPDCPSLRGQFQDTEQGNISLPAPTNAQLQVAARIAEDTVLAMQLSLWRARSHTSPASVHGQLQAALGGSTGMAVLAGRLAAAFAKYAQKVGHSQPWLAWLATHSKWDAFCAEAVLNFVRNDLLWAACHFLDRAQGSFGLALVSELDSGCLVLAALKQPMTLTVLPQAGALLYSSEAQATLQPLPRLASMQTPSSSSWKSAQAPDIASAEPSAMYRIDMNDTAGEVYLVRYQAAAAGCPDSFMPSVNQLHMAHMGKSDAETIHDASSPWPLFSSYPSNGKLAQTAGQTHGVTDHQSASIRQPRIHDRIPACHGSEVVYVNGLQLHMSVYRLAGKRFIDRQEFLNSHRLVSLQDNPYIPLPRPLTGSGTRAWRHQAERDLADIPAVLQRLHASWQEHISFNSQTASDLSEMLMLAALGQGDSRLLGGPHTQMVDLLLVGMEASLWTAEQFAADLKAVVPAVNILAISANTLLAHLADASGGVTSYGLTLGRLGVALDKRHTVALCVSHSGQTFPTLQAARMLSRSLPGRVFAMSGSIDTCMSLVVGQSNWKGAPFARRSFVTCVGWRGQTESAGLTAVATHHCLTELLLHLLLKWTHGQHSQHGQFRQHGQLGQLGQPGQHSQLGQNGYLGQHGNSCSSGGSLLSRPEAISLALARNTLLSQALPNLAGYTQEGVPQPSAAHTALVSQGQRWALHIVEGPLAWLLSAIYIFSTVISGHPPFASIAQAIGVGGLKWLGHVLDSLAYVFCPLLFCLLLRILQRRPLWARLGRRTLVIVDLPYVHQLLEAYVSKKFALSYSIASLDVHGSDPLDHFVHSFTHRVARGLLLAVGRPDGRVYSQAKAESWLLLGLTQAKVIRSLGCTAEVVTVGHNPFSKPIFADHSIVLPSHSSCKDLVSSSGHGVQPLHQQAALECTLEHGRAPALASGSQALLESLVESRFSSLERLVAMQVMFYHMAARVASFWPLCFSLDRSQSGLRIASTASPVSATELHRKHR